VRIIQPVCSDLPFLGANSRLLNAFSLERDSASVTCKKITIQHLKDALSSPRVEGRAITISIKTRVQGVGCRMQGEGCKVKGVGCRVKGVGCGVKGVGCRV